VRLVSLVTHLPSGRLSTEDIIMAAGNSPAEARVFRRMFGIDQVAVFPECETIAVSFERLAESLAAAHDGPRPDAVIYAHGQPLQHPSGRSPIHILCRDHPFFSDVMRRYEVDQHNCGGLFWALDLARTLLRAGLSRSIAVVGGDSHVGLPPGDRYVPGCTLMGDAFCAMIVDDAPGGLQLGPIALQTYPEFARGRAGTSAEMGAFFAAHSGIVCKALDGAGFDWTGNAPLLPHNVNRLAWRQFCRETGLAEAQVRLGLLPDIGHCYTCDPFLLLDRERHGLALGQSCMTISIGMGGYAGACKVTRATASAPGTTDSHDTETCTCSQPILF